MLENIVDADAMPMHTAYATFADAFIETWMCEQSMDLEWGAWIAGGPL